MQFCLLVMFETFSRSIETILVSEAIWMIWIIGMLEWIAHGIETSHCMTEI